MDAARMIRNGHSQLWDYPVNVYLAAIEEWNDFVTEQNKAMKEAGD